MRYTFAQVSFSFYAEGSHEEIKQKVEESLNMACSYLENNLKHEAIGYSFQQFKTDEDEG